MVGLPDYIEQQSCLGAGRGLDVYSLRYAQCGLDSLRLNEYLSQHELIIWMAALKVWIQMRFEGHCLGRQFEVGEMVEGERMLVEGVYIVSTNQSSLERLLCTIYFSCALWITTYIPCLYSFFVSPCGRDSLIN